MRRTRVYPFSAYLIRLDSRATRPLSKLILTLGSLLRFSSWKSNLLFFISCSSSITTKNSSKRRQKQLKLTDSDELIMRLYVHCSRLTKQCKMNDSSNSYIKCIRLSRDCNLLFSTIKWRSVRKKRDRLFREMKKTSKKTKKTVTKISRLQKQFKLMNQKKRFIINNEF